MKLFWRNQVPVPKYNMGQTFYHFFIGNAITSQEKFTFLPAIIVIEEVHMTRKEVTYGCVAYSCHQDGTINITRGTRTEEELGRCKPSVTDALAWANHKLEEGFAPLVKEMNKQNLKESLEVKE